VKQAIARALRMARHPAAAVAAGIFASRLVGLLRVRAFSYYFGLQSDAADAFNAAFRIPNLLQNLFGEGALSGSFIPVYSALRARGATEAAAQMARTVFALLAVAVSVLSLVGVLGASWVIAGLAPGFTGPKRELTIALVRVLFPGAGVLVLSAWCLGVLNSHRRFLLSYSAPIVWNIAIIIALVWRGPHVAEFDLAIVAAWASVLGSAAQLLVQVPTVMSLLRDFRPRWDTVSENVRTVVSNFLPVFVGRGVVQISGYIDAVIASLLGTGALAALTNAQALYMLPVSLFGMSVSAAELPAMSSAVGEKAEVAEYLRSRLDGGLRRIAFLVIPSAMAFLALGDILAGALFKSGRFTQADSVYVWSILAGSAVGLLASTLGRLYASTYYALRDARTPLRYAIVRVVLTSGLGYLFAIPLPGMLGIDAHWGVAGLTASAGIAGWVEFLLLRRTLNARIGRTGLHASFVARLWLSAALAAAAAWGVKELVGARPAILLAILTIVPYGAVYFASTAALGVPEVRTVLGRLSRRSRG